MLSVHGHTGVCTAVGIWSHQCLLSDLSPFSCICRSTVERTLCHVSVCFIPLPILGMLPSCDLLSGQTVNTVYICCRFPSVIFFLYDILFVMSDLLLFHFQISPRQPQTRVFSTNKQSVYTWTYWPCIILRFHIFSKDSPHVVRKPFLCLCFHLFGLILPKLSCSFSCQFTFG
jgi:hypothetical protein